MRGHQALASHGGGDTSHPLEACAAHGRASEDHSGTAAAAVQGVAPAILPLPLHMSGVESRCGRHVARLQSSSAQRLAGRARDTCDWTWVHVPQITSTQHSRHCGPVGWCRFSLVGVIGRWRSRPQLSGRVKSGEGAGSHGLARAPPLQCPCVDQSWSPKLSRHSTCSWGESAGEVVRAGSPFVTPRSRSLTWPPCREEASCLLHL